MDKYIEAEITQNVFIHRFPTFQNLLLLGRLIIDKEELVFDKERNILSQKSRDYLPNKQGEIRV